MDPMAQDSKNRTPSVYLGITLALFILFAVRIAYIVIVEKDTAKSYDDPAVAQAVVRGDITDRNGNVMASQTSSWNLYFRLNAVDDLDFAAMTVSPYISMTVDEIVDRAADYSTYALIRSNIDMTTAEELTKAVQDAGLGGCIDITRVQTRSYASLFHACQLIGFMNREGVGAEGLEYRFDDILSPYPGLGEDVTYGADIALTLDMDIQYLVDVQVQNIAYENNPDYIMALVADARTGEILAMSSYPWYDLNYFNLSTPDQRLNRCAAYNYEPGSVFKIFTLARCMDAGVDVQTPFICDGSETFTVNGTSFTIGCHTPHGQVDARQMVSLSCNGAIASWCLQLSDEDFYDYLTSLGFGSRPELPVPGLSAGYISPVEFWSARSKATMAFGQEINVNALQIVQAATAIANDGVMVPLSVISTITDHSGNELYRNTPEEGRRVMSAETARQIRSYMVTAVEEGTASKARMDNISLAGKTGTAEIINPETGRYSDGTNLASTILLAPADEPQYIIYIAVSAPRGNSVWGADVAAPGCAAIVRGLLSQGKLTSQGARVLQVS